MKRLLSVLMIVGFGMSTPSIATSFFVKQNCPPIAKVTNINFIRSTVIDHRTNEWLLASTEYIHEGTVWNTAFRVALPSIHHEIEAIEEGTRHFKHKVTFLNPKTHEEHGHFVCVYADVNGQYLVGAVTPPLYSPVVVP